MPCAMLSRISTSRGDSGAKIGAASWPYTASSRNSLRTRDATAGFAKTLSLIRYSPAKTRRMIVTLSARPEDNSELEEFLMVEFFGANYRLS